MKFGVVNKSAILNSSVLHTLQRNIKRLAVIIRKTNIKLGILKEGGGGTRKEPWVLFYYRPTYQFILFFQFYAVKMS